MTSMVVGLVSIWALLSYLRRNNYNIFVIYRLALGTLVIVLASAGLIS